MLAQPHVHPRRQSVGQGVQPLAQTVAAHTQQARLQLARQRQPAGWLRQLGQGQRQIGLFCIYAVLQSQPRRHQIVIEPVAQMRAHKRRHAAARLHGAGAQQAERLDQPTAFAVAVHSPAEQPVQR